MQYVRVSYRGQSAWGILEPASVRLLSRAPYLGGEPAGTIVPLADYQLLAPCEPSKIVAVGKNYYDHIREFDNAVPDTPILFIKPSTSVLAPGQPIILPEHNLSRQVDYEGELALVIGKTAHHIRAEDAAAYICGYTCLNDVTARDLQKKDGQWTRAKGFDTFAPIGPALATDLDLASLTITTRLNDHIVQHAPISDLIWSVSELLAFITRVMTLLPGDVVTTGTPAGVGPLKAGDVVSVKINGIGTLSNPVIQG